MKVSVEMYPKMKIFLGDTIRPRATITDEETALDPDSQSVKLYDPDKIEKDSTTESELFHHDNGVFFAVMRVPNVGVVGNWKIVWGIISDSRKATGVCEFYVGETP